MSDCPTGRGSGRTQWMIDQLCDAIADGQPKARVWGHTMDFALNGLRPRIIDGLKARGVRITSVYRNRIVADGSLIVFASIGPISAMEVLGTRGFGEFVDHFAEGEE